MRAWILAFCIMSTASRCTPGEESPAGTSQDKRVAAEGTEGHERAAPANAAPAADEAAAGADEAADEGRREYAHEACGELILVAYTGAELAPASITRDRDAAEKRAGELLSLAKEQDAVFADVARQHSDAPSSAARGGKFGTFHKDDWPALYASLREPLFALAVGQIANEALHTPHGYAILRRCEIEKAHVRHILVRYAGAKRAPADITRDKAAAQAKAKSLLQQLDTGGDFATLASAHSEDPSAARGGDLGYLGRGLLEAPFEATLFALPVGGRSGLVETAFGYHILERLPAPDEGAAAEQENKKKLASP